MTRKVALNFIFVSGAVPCTKDGVPSTKQGLQCRWRRLPAFNSTLVPKRRVPRPRNPLTGNTVDDGAVVWIEKGSEEYLNYLLEIRLVLRDIGSRLGLLRVLGLCCIVLWTGSVRTWPKSKTTQE